MDDRNRSQGVLPDITPEVMEDIDQDANTRPGIPSWGRVVLGVVLCTFIGFAAYQVGLLLGEQRAQQASQLAWETESERWMVRSQQNIEQLKTEQQALLASKDVEIERLTLVVQNKDRRLIQAEERTSRALKETAEALANIETLKHQAHPELKKKQVKNVTKKTVKKTVSPNRRQDAFSLTLLGMKTMAGTRMVLIKFAGQVRSLRRHAVIDGWRLTGWDDQSATFIKRGQTQKVWL